MVLPYLLQQHGAGHRLTGVAHHEFQQLEFARLQVDLLALAQHPAVDQVHLQVADLQDGLHRAGLMAAGQRLDPGAELGEGIGLDQVVVAAGLQARHAVVDLSQGREHQHRRAVAVAAQGLDHRQAVHARHHAVHHHDVEAILVGGLQAIGAVGGDLALVPGLAEAPGHGFGRLDVVFNDQNAHIDPPMRTD